MTACHSRPVVYAHRLNVICIGVLYHRCGAKMPKCRSFIQMVNGDGHKSPYPHLPIQAKFGKRQ